MPEGGIHSIQDIVERRAFIRSLSEILFPNPPDPNVISIDDYTIPGLNGAPDIGLRVFTPVTANEVNPGIFYIHGGGFVTGSIFEEQSIAIQLALEINAVVVSVEYRLAP